MTEDPEELARKVYIAFADTWRMAHQLTDCKEASEEWDLIAALLYRVAAWTRPKAPDVLLLADIAADHAETSARQNVNAA